MKDLDRLNQLLDPGRWSAKTQELERCGFSVGLVICKHRLRPTQFQPPCIIADKEQASEQRLVNVTRVWKGL